MPLWKEKRHVLLPFGVPLAGQRGGGVAKGVTEGYTVSSLKNAPYDYVISIIASRERVFPLFTSLSAFVGTPCMAVLEDHLEDPPKVYESRVCTKKEVLDTFTEYSFQLVNDGFVAFGLASEELEAFVGDHKDVTVYCRSSRQALHVIKQYRIPMDDKLTPIGRGPHYHVQIPLLFENDRIKKMCESIPREEIEKFNSNPEAYKKFFQEIVRKLQMKV